MFAPDQEEQIVQEAKTAMDHAYNPFTGSLDQSRNVLNSAQFSYEGVDKVAQARDLLAQGQDWNTVASTVEDKVNFGEQMHDLEWSLLLDPINLIDWLGPTGHVGGGMKALMEESKIAQTSRMLVDASERVDDVEKAMQVFKPAWYEKIPIVGKLFQPTALTAVGRVVSEAGDFVMKLARDAKDVPGVVEKLAAIGVREAPELAAFKLLLNPSMEHAEQIREILGLGRYAVEGEPALKMGLQDGTIVDRLWSEAAIRTRKVLSGLSSSDQLLEDWSKIDEAWSKAFKLKNGIGTSRHPADRSRAHKGRSDPRCSPNDR
jgi:hypothetical protein